MLPAVLFIAGIVRALKQILLMGEMIMRVVDQPVQDAAKHPQARAAFDNVVQLVEKRQEPLVLVVYLPDAR
jgi:hypothetical protein